MERVYSDDRLETPKTSVVLNAEGRYGVTHGFAKGGDFAARFCRCTMTRTLGGVWYPVGHAGGVVLSFPATLVLGHFGVIVYRHVVGIRRARGGRGRVREEGKGGGGDGAGVRVDVKGVVGGVALLWDGKPMEVGGRGIGFSSGARESVGLI
jgi:hypothetical protein